MIRISVPLLAAVVLCGCGTEPSADSPKDPPRPPGASSGGPGESITPVGPNVGGTTPVTGGENLGGTSGGGIAQAMKNRARASASLGQGSQTPGDGSGDGADTGQ